MMTLDQSQITENHMEAVTRPSHSGTNDYLTIWARKCFFRFHNPLLYIFIKVSKSQSRKRLVCGLFGQHPHAHRTKIDNVRRTRPHINFCTRTRTRTRTFFQKQFSKKKKKCFLFLKINFFTKKECADVQHTSAPTIGAPTHLHAHF